MSEYTFRELELKYGELIYIVNEKGEGISGLYEDEYNNSNETFRFSNYSNGKTETIEINKMHSIQRINWSIISNEKITERQNDLGKTSFFPRIMEIWKN